MDVAGQPEKSGFYPERTVPSLSRPAVCGRQQARGVARPARLRRAGDAGALPAPVFPELAASAIALGVPAPGPS
jgi:hypothetical protein